MKRLTASPQRQKKNALAPESRSAVPAAHRSTRESPLPSCRPQQKLMSGWLPSPTPCSARYTMHTAYTATAKSPP